MFTWRHFLWLAISAVLILSLVTAADRKKPALNQVLTTALIIALLSEIVKMVSVIDLVPSANGELWQTICRKTAVSYPATCSSRSAVYRTTASRNIRGSYPHRSRMRFSLYWRVFLCKNRSPAVLFNDISVAK